MIPAVITPAYRTRLNHGVILLIDTSYRSGGDHRGDRKTIGLEFDVGFSPVGSAKMARKWPAIAIFCLCYSAKVYMDEYYSRVQPDIRNVILLINYSSYLLGLQLAIHHSKPQFLSLSFSFPSRLTLMDHDAVVVQS